MPELGKPETSKKKKAAADQSQVVSAYSEEGKARNAARPNGLSRKFKTLLIILYVLLFFAAMAIIYCAWKFKWF
ncbi:MAG: hypothetical protein BWY98_01315 [Tenericutes bacterium ADurb.BinA155]|jgi:hypothetical protein|nr:MAG: hypothetical protein BWY98_01315 [Tenericutes bacterium ADurb.BinA155]